MGAALVVTLVTGADYVIRAYRLSQSPRDQAEDTGSAPASYPAAPVPPDAHAPGPDRESGGRIRPPRAD